MQIYTRELVDYNCELGGRIGPRKRKLGFLSIAVSAHKSQTMIRQVISMVVTTLERFTCDQRVD
jgi:hypothetical protein